MDIGVWHKISCGEDNMSKFVTEVMNVSGGCIVRSRNFIDTPAVSQTLILNMMAQRVKDTDTYKLVPGTVVP